MSARFPPAAVLFLLASVSLLAAAPAVILADEADDQYAVAATHYSRGQWKYAAEGFASYLRDYPTHSQAGEAVFYLGEALLQLGQYDEAQGHFEEYLRRQPEGRLARSALFRSAEAAYLGGRRGQAQPGLEQYLAKYPEDKLSAYVLSYLADLAMDGGDAAAAARYYEQGLESHGQSPLQDEFRFGLARALEKLGESVEAEAYYLALAGKSASPLADDAQFRLGAQQYAESRFDESVGTFETFEKRWPESPLLATVRMGRGWALVKLGRLDEAASVFQTIVDDPQRGPEARYWLGLTLKSQEQWRPAADTLLQAAAASPQHKLVTAMRVQAGTALMHAGDLPAAEAQFDAVAANDAAENEWRDEALRGKLQVALQKGDGEAVDRLAARFNEQFASSPLRSDVERIRAQSLLERKDYRRAIEVLRPLVDEGAEGPQGLEDRYLLTLAYDGDGRREEALVMLAPVLESTDGRLRADALLAHASLLVALRRYAEAVDPLEQLLATRPAGDAEVKALRQLAISYAYTSRLNEAKQTFATLAAKHPNHALIVPAAEQLAEAAFQAGDTTWSGELFDRLRRTGRSPEETRKGMSGLGWSQFQAGQFEEAAATLKTLLDAGPEPAVAAEAALVRGRALERLGRRAEALEMYRLVIDRYPESSHHAHALWSAATICYDAQRSAEAAALYAQLVEKHPDFEGMDGVLYNWAWTLVDQGMAAQAAAPFERIVREHPESHYWPDSAFRLARQEYESLDYTASRSLVESLLTRSANNPVVEHALYLKAQIAAAERNWDEARDSFAKILEQFPNTTQRRAIEYGLAEADAQQGKYAPAAERLQRLIDETPRAQRPEWFPLAHLRLAQALASQDKWAEAHDAAAVIETEFPGFAEQYEADFIVGRGLAAQADFEAARQSYQKVLESPNGGKTETAAKARLMIAETYFHQKNYNAARKTYLQVEALYAYPEIQSAALFMAARCHESLGEWREAAELYDQIMNHYPQTEHAREAGERRRAAQQRAAARPAS